MEGPCPGSSTSARTRQEASIASTMTRFVRVMFTRYSMK